MKRWIRIHWRRFLAWAVAREEGVILRAAGTRDVRASFEQALLHIDRVEGPPRRVKGKLKEQLRRIMDVWDQGLPWTPEGRATPLDHKVVQALTQHGVSPGP